MLLNDSAVAVDAQPLLGKFAQPLPQALLWLPLSIVPLSVAISVKGIKCVVLQVYTSCISSVPVRQIDDVAPIAALQIALHSFVGVTLRALQPNKHIFFSARRKAISVCRAT